MKKTLATTIAAAAVVLLTATFSFAEYTAAGVTNFPFFQLGVLNSWWIDHGFPET